jgi:hypothetical protein
VNWQWNSRLTIFAKDGLFFAIWRNRSDIFHSAVFFAGLKEEASHFKFRFSIATQDGKEHITYIQPTHSFIEDISDVLVADKSVTLHTATIRKYLIGSKLPLELEILQIDDCDTQKKTVNDFL